MHPPWRPAWPGIAGPPTTLWDNPTPVQHHRRHRMQAALLVGTKRPLEVEEVALDPPGPGEVHVRVAASGVCHSCLHSIDGTGGDSPFPMVLGDEGAGVVERVGPGVATV